MRPTEILSAEHRIIEKALGRMRKLCDRTAAGDFDQEAFTATLAFFREFADKRHHAKEEQLLFPALNRRGMPLDGGPLADMAEEHEIGRQLLAVAEEALPRARQGDREARRRVAGTCRQYADLELDHIAQEDSVLLPSAAQVLTPEDEERLAAEFAALDATGFGEKERAAVAV